MRRGDGIYLRGHTWMLDIFHNGQRHAVRLGKLISRSVAKELAAVERAKIVKGEVGITKQRKDISFDKAVEEFLKWAVTSKRSRTAAGYKHQTRQLGKTFSGMKLSQIHPFLVEKYKQKRSGEGARIGANRELTLLKNIFNRCSQWGKYEGENPLCRVKRFDEPKRKLRFLDHEEEARLLAAAGEPLRSIMLCGIHAGLRIESEALTLRWEDIDLKRKTLTVQAAYAKNKETRSIPMNAVLRSAFEQMYAEGSREGMIFRCWKGPSKGQGIKSIRTAFTTACRNAKLPGVSPHTLRHTFASRLMMAGVDIRTIQELGGWKEIKMLERYAHLSQEHKALAVEKLVLQESASSPITGPNTRSESAAKSFRARSSVG